jgi:hypothetical protein
MMLVPRLDLLHIRALADGKKSQVTLFKTLAHVIMLAVDYSS